MFACFAMFRKPTICSAHEPAELVGLIGTDVMPILRTARVLLPLQDRVHLRRQFWTVRAVFGAPHKPNHRDRL